MQHECKKHLEDIRRAAELILQFASGRTFDDYQNDALLRSGIERQFEIIGEALNRLFKEDAAVAAQISEHQKIVAFRNILIHGYDAVDDQIVWDAAQNKLPILHQEVISLLNAPDP